MNTLDAQDTVRPRGWRLLAALLALVLAASACGSSADDASDASSDTSTAVADEPTQTIPADGAAGGDVGSSSDDSAADADDTSDDSAADGSGDTAAPAAGDIKRTRFGDRVMVADLEATSGRFEGRITISGDAEFPEGVELVFLGAFDSTNDASEISIDLGSVALAAAEAEGTDLGPMAALFEEPMVVRTIGDRSFISWGLFSLLTGTDEGWIETEADDASDITSGFGGTGNGSPVDILTVLEDANADITEIGTEEVRGVSTTHIRALIDVAEMEASLSDEDRATLERDLGDVPTDALPMDIWIDDDGLIRRYSLDLSDFDENDDIDQAGLVFEFFDYGEDITIEVPPADQIISADELDPGAFDFGN